MQGKRILLIINALDMLIAGALRGGWRSGARAGILPAWSASRSLNG